ncbi:hypothetical protein JOC54_004084 [Alkalihalobacillus xiaoxiensis]|uniref:Uncharacterized protein n=1 Tax=Shouchella xiaoxiensis TaxID=766895 RepID=A0ABS2T0M4_9BACI|nr:hypothetical protein [Shouchella xiaoxiensis]MBM7840791.1 hypothetical protein [Shouchella xiaoxiensis]
MERIRHTTGLKWILICSILILLVSLLLFAAQVYFTHVEANSLTEGCYDNGGKPKIVKTLTEVKSFQCNE